MDTKTNYVYILTNFTNSTFYIGVTSDISRRLSEHREKVVDGFTKEYQLWKLIYIEETTDVYTALGREKQLKNWHRDWKLNLIKSVNPQLKDLSSDFGRCLNKFSMTIKL